MEQLSLLGLLHRKKWVLINSLDPVFATKSMYRKTFGKKLDLKNPRDFNQKIQYLKLNTYYNNPLITECVDKIRVKDYVTRKGLGEIVPKLFAVYEDVQSIDWNELPDSYAIKCNHGCSYNILVPDKRYVDTKEMGRLLNSWLNENQWKWYCETQYKFIKKRIFAEELIPGRIDTIKIYCFNGEPKMLYVSTNGEKGVEDPDRYIDFYDTDWNRLEDISFYGHEPHVGGVARPECLDEMLDVSRTLSGDFPFVRVDLNWNGDKYYFGEMTFVPTGGFMIIPQSRLDQMGDWLDIWKT